jgi:hypothetical protein
MPSLQATNENGLPPFYPLPLNHPPLAINQALDGHRRDQTNPMNVSFIHQLVDHDGMAQYQTARPSPLFYYLSFGKFGM